MAKIKYRAIDPDGTVHARSSARVYTHTVVARLDQAYARTLAKTEGFKASIKQYELHADYASKGWTPAKWMSPEIADRHKQEGFACGGQFIAKHGPDARAYAEKVYQAEVVRIDADTAYHNFGWCGRPDLAAKLADKYRSDPCYRDVTILQAEGR